MNKRKGLIAAIQAVDLALQEEQQAANANISPFFSFIKHHKTATLFTVSFILMLPIKKNYSSLALSFCLPLFKIFLTK